MNKYLLTFILTYLSVVQSDYCSHNDQSDCLTNITALILARGGSKGVHRKNLYKLHNGQDTLLSRSIKVINESNLFPEIWISTEDNEIAEEAKKYYSKVHNRPIELAQDNTSSLAAVQEFLQKHPQIENLALFQCTSVFLKIKYIEKAVKLFESADCVFSATRSFKLRWKENSDGFVEPLNFNPSNRPRRQDWNGELIENGMFYFARKNLIDENLFQNNNCKIVEILEEDSLEIDNYNDIKVAEALLNKNL